MYIQVVRSTQSKESGRTYELQEKTLSIGRSRESDIFLEDPAANRLHASILNNGNGSYERRDEGSANGVLVHKYQPYPLREGDTMHMGQTILTFERLFSP